MKNIKLKCTGLSVEEKQILLGAVRRIKVKRKKDHRPEIKYVLRLEYKNPANK